MDTKNNQDLLSLTKEFKLSKYIFSQIINYLDITTLFTIRNVNRFMRNNSGISSRNIYHLYKYLITLGSTENLMKRYRRTFLQDAITLEATLQKNLLNFKPLSNITEEEIFKAQLLYIRHCAEQGKEKKSIEINSSREIHPILNFDKEYIKNFQPLISVNYSLITTHILNYFESIRDLVIELPMIKKIYIPHYGDITTNKFKINIPIVKNSHTKNIDNVKIYLDEIDEET